MAWKSTGWLARGFLLQEHRHAFRGLGIGLHVLIDLFQDFRLTLKRGGKALDSCSMLLKNLQEFPTDDADDGDGPESGAKASEIGQK